MEHTATKQMVFSCDAGAFAIYDSEEARNLLRHGSARPLMALKVGPGNIFESSPKRVLRQSPSAVSVQCVDGSIIHLDFGEETAIKQTDQGRYRYRGDLQDGNKGEGYMPA
ncbi:MAG: hypothetical protein HY681_15240 [Chloroflexi bacterium]|nr:hypothetical protein [Chloroflexota bacterium]